MNVAISNPIKVLSHLLKAVGGVFLLALMALGWILEVTLMLLIFAMGWLMGALTIAVVMADLLLRAIWARWISPRA